MSSEAKIVGYCRACGKALDEGSVRAAQGTIYCEEHVPMSTGTPTTTAPGQSLTTVDVSPYTASPYTSATPPPIPNPDVSPGLAFGLGFIPGVGAIYNGQYAKGLVHAIMVGLIISILALVTTQEAKKGMAIAGVICCGIAMLFGLIRLIAGGGIL